MVLTVILEMKPFQERAIRLPVDIPFKANLLSRSKREDRHTKKESSQIPLQFFSTSIFCYEKKNIKLEKNNVRWTAFSVKFQNHFINVKKSWINKKIQEKKFFCFSLPHCVGWGKHFFRILQWRMGGKHGLKRMRNDRKIFVDSQIFDCVPCRFRCRRCVFHLSRRLIEVFLLSAVTKAISHVQSVKTSSAATSFAMQIHLQIAEQFFSSPNYFPHLISCFSWLIHFIRIVFCVLLFLLFSYIIYKKPNR